MAVRDASIPFLFTWLRKIIAQLLVLATIGGKPVPNAVGPRVDFSRTAMSKNKIHLGTGAYAEAAALSQGASRRPRSQSLRRCASKATEVSSDSIKIVYRALRKGETPTQLRPVIPDTNDFTSCHGICSLCPPFRIFRLSASSQCNVSTPCHAPSDYLHYIEGTFRYLLYVPSRGTSGYHLEPIFSGRSLCHAAIPCRAWPVPMINYVGDPVGFVDSCFGVKPVNSIPFGYDSVVMSFI